MAIPHHAAGSSVAAELHRPMRVHPLKADAPTSCFRTIRIEVQPEILVDCRAGDKGWMVQSFSNADDKVSFPLTPRRSVRRIVSPASIFSTVYLALMLLGATSTRRAEVQGEGMSPLSEVKATVNRAVAILREQQVSVGQRRRELQQLAENHLDLAKMARGSLGDHWDELAPTQREEFVDVQEADLGAIRVGAPARVNLPTHPPMVFPGQVLGFECSFYFAGFDYPDGFDRKHNDYTQCIFHLLYRCSPSEASYRSALERTRQLRAY